MGLFKKKVDSKTILMSINICKTMEDCSDARKLIDEYELTDHSNVVYPTIKDMRDALCSKTFEVFEATKSERTMDSFK